MLRPALLLLALTIVASSASAQPAVTKYWVFFHDKAMDAAGRSAVAVTERAEARRALRGRPVPAHLDVPVAPRYVRALEDAGARVVVESRWLNAVSAEIAPADLPRVAALPFVREVRRVASLAPMHEGIPLPLASEGGPDPGPSGFQLAFVAADRGLDRGYNGTGVRLGFLDTLFDFFHPALVHIPNSGRLIAVTDFTGQTQENYHGLATTSIAMGFDEGDLIGPAYGIEALAATTEYAPTETHQEEDFFVAGMEWMEANGADVVNVSLSYTLFDPGEGDYTYEMLDGDTTPFTRAVDWAAALGVAVVVAMGNYGDDPWRYLGAPADADSAIAVAAARPDSSRASFSSVGPTADGRIKPDVAALGAGVYLAVPDGGYTHSSGTSAAAPMIAGIVCQLLQADPTLNPIQVRDLLRATASQSATPDTLLGWGIANADAALAVTLGPPPEPPGALSLSLFPSVAEAGHRVTLRLETSRAGAYSVEVFDALGRRVLTPFSGTLGMGRQALPLNLPALPSGPYFVRLTGPDGTAAARLAVIR